MELFAADGHDAGGCERVTGKSGMRPRKMVCFGGLLLLLALTGCGTIFGGTTELVSIQTTPPGVSVTTVPVTGPLTTPTSVALERKNNYQLTFLAEGYESAEFQIRRQMRTGILVADILLTGLIGVVVDAVTGGWYQLEPKTVTLSLQSATATAPDDIEVFVSIQDSEDRGTVELELEASAPGVVMHVAKRSD